MEVLARVNAIRVQRRLSRLRFHGTLWNAARDHSAEQQKHGYMGHGSPDPKRARLGQRMAIAGYRGTAFAEVVAWGYADAAAVVEGWMNSSGHRSILLDPELSEAAFSRIGQYWTGNFGAPARRARRPAARPAPRAAPPRGSAPRPTSPTPPRSSSPRPTSPTPPWQPRRPSGGG